MSKNLQLSAVIEKVATRVDNSFVITISTQELLPEQAVILFATKGKQGWMLFSENLMTESDLPKEPAPEFKGKENPMASLNRTLFVYWDTCTSKIKPFNEFVREWVEKKKTEIKDYLPK